jgi:dimethylhistidine N-methyltransferase
MTKFGRDVRDGLTRQPRELPPEYFYDSVGSKLFEAITLLPEYGLTRADARILANSGRQILSAAGWAARIIELGSGSGEKTRLLLEIAAAREPVVYLPIDISPDSLTRCSAALAGIAGLRIETICAGYLDGLAGALAHRPAAPILLLFLGSTIGNYSHDDARGFLCRVRQQVKPGDLLLLGTDLQKPEPVLLQAYDDPAGVTAAFNLNLLARINRELGADFDPRRFRHQVRYDSTANRIEMHLEATTAHTVSIPGADLTVHFEQGETIWTESSYKFTPHDVSLLAQAARFRVAGQWVDDEWPFAETLLEAL